MMNKLKATFYSSLVFVLIGCAIESNANEKADVNEEVQKFLVTHLAGKTIGPIQAFLQYNQAKYPLKEFPLSRVRFEAFKTDIKKSLEKSVVKFTHSQIASQVIDNLLYKIFLVELATGEKLPVVTCKNLALPPKNHQTHVNHKEVPMVVFSGHTTNGLFDLLVNKSGYQKAMAWRLCEAGYPTATSGKIDAGFASRNWHVQEEPLGEDENLIGLLLQETSIPLASRQLSLAVATVEIAQQDFVKNKVITLGISLGGWIAVHVGIVKEDVIAVIDFGAHDTMYEQYGVDSLIEKLDFSAVFPDFFDLGDRNLFQLSLAGQKPLLLVHGAKEPEDIQQGWKITKRLVTEQYKVLESETCLVVLEHEGGHEFTNTSMAHIEIFYNYVVTPPPPPRKCWP